MSSNSTNMDYFGFSRQLLNNYKVWRFYLSWQPNLKRPKRERLLCLCHGLCTTRAPSARHRHLGIAHAKNRTFLFFLELGSFLELGLTFLAISCACKAVLPQEYTALPQNGMPPSECVCDLAPSRRPISCLNAWSVP